jgi:hypothetical protein
MSALDQHLRRIDQVLAGSNQPAGAPSNRFRCLD